MGSEQFFKNFKSDGIRDTWLITGVAGFIGSNLLETLLKLDQKVVGIDNFSTGSPDNLESVRLSVSLGQWQSFEFLEGDIRNLSDCSKACQGVNYVLHQAALGSVPRSIANPIATNSVNIDGFLNMLIAARDAGVRRLVYAASSSTYGDHLDLPKIEEIIGKPLSPYAVTKYVNELYANVFYNTYGLNLVGLRYFNVFGPRQSVSSAYAAVIPKWVSSLLKGEAIWINGDGSTSRDFSFVSNVVLANLLAAKTDNSSIGGEVFNIACGESTTLNNLFNMIKDIIGEKKADILMVKANYAEFRAGDVKHSLASINKAKAAFGYEPVCTIKPGLESSIAWYLRNFENK